MDIHVKLSKNHPKVFFPGISRRRIVSSESSMKVVTFGELMIRLQPYNYERFVQADHLEFTFGGGEANVAVSLANYGVEGVSFEFNSEGEPELTELVTNSPEGYAFPVALIKYTSATPCSVCINSRNYLGYTDAQMKATEVWLRTGESLGIPGAVWETDAQNEYAAINTDLGSYVSTNCLQFITGAKPMSDWDSFIDQAYSAFDIDRMIELYQEAVDAYMARGQA